MVLITTPSAGSAHQSAQGHVGTGSRLEGMSVILFTINKRNILKNVYFHFGEKNDACFCWTKSKFSDVCSRLRQSAEAALMPLLLINRACVSSRNSHMVSNHTVQVLFQHKDTACSPERELRARDHTTWAVTGLLHVILLALSDTETPTQQTGRGPAVCTQISAC